MSSSTPQGQHPQQPSPTMQSPQPSPQLSPVTRSPARSRASSRGSHLTLDLSAIPPLTQPAEPTNTLLITNLNNPDVFSGSSIQQIRGIINSHAPLASWSPLKSFRRIVCSFLTKDDAIAVRSALDGECILGDRVRVYFGEHTPLQREDQHLQAPTATKQFFISPPPSPPLGWEIKNEDPPNAVVVAEDLAHALAKLTCRPSPNSMGEPDDKSPIGRPRSASSVVLFEPEDEEMPAISVDDYTDGSGDEEERPVKPAAAGEVGKVVATARPPVELMHHA